MERPTYTLIVHPDEVPVLRLALRLFRDDLGHPEHRVAAVAGEVLDKLAADGVREVVLDAAEMKVTWNAAHAMLDDTVREQQADRAHLHAVLERLPGEHDMRAIDLDAELDRR